MQILTSPVSDSRQILADQHVSTTDLAAAIEACLLLSMDARVKLSDRGNFLALALALRDQLRVLVGVVFEEGTNGLKEANGQLKAVNQQLKTTVDEINQTAKTIEMLGGVVEQLARLIKFVHPVF